MNVDVTAVVGDMRRLIYKMFEIKISSSTYCLGQTVWVTNNFSFLLPSCPWENFYFCHPFPSFYPSKSERYKMLAFPASFADIVWTCDHSWPMKHERRNLVALGKIFCLSRRWDVWRTLLPPFLHVEVLFVWMWGLKLWQPSWKLGKRPRVTGKLKSVFLQSFLCVIKITFYCKTPLYYGILLFAAESILMKIGEIYQTSEILS